MSRSDAVKLGPERTPHRSLLKACGFTDAQMRKPFIGIVNSFSEIVPGHTHLQQIARAVKDGVLMAGGTPFEFNTIAVCDGIAMGHEGMRYSLCTRELIADTVECMARAHAFDALVFIPNCDKIVPGMLMAAARLNLPSIFVSGGPMLSLGGKDLNSAFEAVGAYMRVPKHGGSAQALGYARTASVWLPALPGLPNPPVQPAVLANRFAADARGGAARKHNGNNQPRYGPKDPQQQVDQPAEKQPVEHTVGPVANNGHRLNINMTIKPWRQPSWRSC